MTNLEHALHSAKDELRSESQMRVKREITVDRLQEQLRAKVIQIFRKIHHLNIIVALSSNRMMN